MTDDVEASLIGRRIRSYRHMRGLSLRVTADLAGLSPAFLSMAENGRRRLRRVADIIALAEVLHVTPGELTGHDNPPTPPASAAAHAAIPALRLTIVGASLTPTDAGIEGIRRAAAEMDRWRDDGDYARIAQRLPGLLSDLHVSLEDPRGAHRQELLRLLGRTYGYTSVHVLNNLGYWDLAFLSLTTAERHALDLGDPATHATIAISRAWLLQNVAPDERVLAIATAAADAVQPHLTTARALRAYGQLHLEAACALARSGAPPEAALDHLAEATDIADRVAEPSGGDVQFGPTTVANVRIWLLATLGRPDDAANASRLTRPGGVVPAYRFTYNCWSGWAMSQLRGHEREAVNRLALAERLAPQRAPHNPDFRRAVSDLLDRPTNDQVGRELRGLAYRLGIAR